MIPIKDRHWITSATGHREELWWLHMTLQSPSGPSQSLPTSRLKVDLLPLQFVHRYDAMPLHTSSRDLKAFITPLGLVRMCTLSSSFPGDDYTKLDKHFPDAAPFIDDIAVAGPKSKYNEEEAMPGMRRCVLKHVQKIDAVLTDCKRAGVLVSGKKAYWGVARMNIVGYEVVSAG